MMKTSLEEGRGRPPGVLFRVDGGRVWGVSLGHVFRCLALARELQKRHQVDVTFLMKDYEAGVQVVRHHGFDVQVLDRGIGHEQEITAIEGWPGNLVVFDLIDVAEKDLGRLMDNGKQVIVLDDTGNKRIEADMVINGSIVPGFHRYPDNGRHTRYYLGPRYCILGEEFDHPSHREIKPEVGTILVSMGGSDPAGLTLKVARFFGTSSLSCDLVFIRGPGFEGREAGEMLLQAYRGRCSVIRNPPALAPLLAAADLAILAGGRTVYEAARLGVPGLIIPSIEHEVPVAEAFARAGAFLSLPSGWQLSEDKFGLALGSTLRRLLGDGLLREHMSRRAGELIDGRGRARTARLLGYIL